MGMPGDCGAPSGVPQTVEDHVRRPAKLLTPGEVAEVFRVDPKTVTRWAQAGRLPSILTPGGHRRFWESDVLRMLKGMAPKGQPEPVREAS